MGGATPAPPPIFLSTKGTKGIPVEGTKTSHHAPSAPEQCTFLIYCIPSICAGIVCLSMMTGVFIERLFPSTTTCPATCLSQQFQQQQFQQL